MPEEPPTLRCRPVGSLVEPMMISSSPPPPPASEAPDPLPPPQAASVRAATVPVPSSSVRRVTGLRSVIRGSRRSEERRVGKESEEQWPGTHKQKKQNKPERRADTMQ